MGDAIGTAYVELGARIDGFTSAFNSVLAQLKQATGQTGETQGAFSSLWAQFAVGFTAASLLQKGIGFITDSIKDAIHEAADYEKSLVGLNAAFSLSGRNMPGMIDDLQQFAESLRALGLASDEDILKTEALLMQMTHLNEDGIKQATEGAIGLSKVFGMDLKQAAEFVGRALESNNYMYIGRYIPAVKNATTAEEKHAAMMDGLARLYQTAIAQTDSYSGSIGRMELQWQEAKKTLGEAILKTGILQKATEFATDALNDLTDALDGYQKIQNADIKESNQRFSILQKMASILGMNNAQLLTLIQTHDSYIDGVGQGNLATFQWIKNLNPLNPLFAALIKATAAYNLEQKKLKAGFTETGAAGKGATEDYKKQLEALDALSKNTGVTAPAIAKLEAAFNGAAKGGKYLDSDLKPVAERLVELKEQAGQHVPTALLIMAGALEKTDVGLGRIEQGSEAFSLALFDMTGNIHSGAVTLSETALPAMTEFGRAARAVGIIMSTVGGAASYLGLKTKDELVKDLGLAIEEFKNLAKSGNATKDDLGAAADKIVAQNKAVGGSFKALPEDVQAAAGKMEDIWKSMNEQIIADFIRSIADIITGQKSLVDAFNELWKSIVSIAVNALASIVQKAAHAGENIGQALTTVTAGPLALAIVGIAAAATAFSALADASNTAANALPALIEKMKVLYQVSDTLAEKMAKFAQMFGIAAAASSYLLDRMKDTGITAKNFAGYMAEATAALDKIGKDSRLTAGELSDANDEFQLLIDAAKNLGLEGSKGITDFILKARAMGLEIASVTAYVQEQLNKIPSALEDLVKNFDKTGGSIEGLGKLAVATFGDMLASGMTFSQALAAMQGPLSALAAEYAKLHLTADPALQALLDLSGVVSANKELFNSVDDLVTITKALNNSAWMTADTFGVLESQAEDYYNKLQKAGLTQDQALREMAPELQNLLDASKKWGYALDPVTQALVDQALNLGYIKKEADADPMATMNTTLGIIATVLERIAKSMGIFVDDLITAKDKTKELGDAISDLPDYPQLPGGGDSGGGGGGGCFVSGTMITMADKSTKPIEKIIVGDKVLSYHPYKREFVAAEVGQTFVHAPDEVPQTILINGTIRATPEHPFFINGIWDEIGNVWVGDNMIGLDEKEVLVTSVEWMSGGLPVYNIHTVSAPHDYFAGGVLVHNKKPGGYAGGGVAWTPQIASIAETGPEIIGSLSDYMAGRPIAGIPQSGSGGGIVNHINLSVYAQTLDRQTIDRSAELIFTAVDREARRRGK